jgi:hyaluronan synthase
MNTPENAINLPFRLLTYLTKGYLLTTTLRRTLIRLIYGVMFLGLLYLILSYRLYSLQRTEGNWFFLIYSILTSIFLFSRFLISFYYKDEHSSQYTLYPSITFIIACKNEEDSIAKTIITCMSSDYPGSMECIAVDDGSWDKTLSEMKKCRIRYKNRLKIISFAKNKGKREAMAEAALIATGDIFVVVDSDSFPQKLAVRHLIEHFLENPKVGAVSGNTRVANAGTNALTKMQSAKYGVSFDIFKACESVFGLVTCCPGCFSAYRREAVMAVLNNWRGQTFLGTRSTYGDDRSLTNFILRKWQVVYCRKAVATTIAPEKFRKFFNQQLRWKKSWIKEGFFNAGSFMWKKNPIASAAFYINLLIPLVGPILVLTVTIQSLLSLTAPIVFISGVITMSMLFGIFYYLIYPNKYWPYITLFTVVYAFVLIWQMPYAIIKLRDTRWGTR